MTAEETNGTRRERGVALVAAYPSTDELEQESMIGDMIADLLHLFGGDMAAAQRALDMGWSHYADEVAEEQSERGGDA